MHLFFTFLIFILALPAHQSAGTQGNAHVKFEIRLASSSLRPGGTGEVEVYLTPNEGIHINTDPAMEFEFERTPSVHFAGITALPKNEKTGYLDVTRPVKYSFTLDKNISKGRRSLRGTVRYFFCSDMEGWCNRFVQPFELRFTVTR